MCSKNELQKTQRGSVQPGPIGSLGEVTVPSLRPRICILGSASIALASRHGIPRTAPSPQLRGWHEGMETLTVKV